TPRNTASAILTENRDKLFVSSKNLGVRGTIFTLSYEPGNFDQALRDYNRWTHVLITHDWPILFSKERFLPRDENGNIIYPLPPLLSGAAGGTATSLPASTTTPTNTATTAPTTFDTLKRKSPERDGEPDRDTSEAKRPHLDIGVANDNNDDDQHPIPTSLYDVVEVRPSTIPNAGRGCFATRRIPAGTTIGFYFGVPMTEDEFDSLKDHVGLASHYSIRYRNTVLDATDENGMPYVNNPLIQCPFHFMNEDLEKRNMVFQEGAAVNQILCTTTREIEAGEELFVAYGAEVDREKWKEVDKVVDPKIMTIIPPQIRTPPPPPPPPPEPKPFKLRIRLGPHPRVIALIGDEVPNLGESEQNAVSSPVEVREQGEKTPQPKSPSSLGRNQKQPKTPSPPRDGNEPSSDEEDSSDEELSSTMSDITPTRRKRYERLVREVIRDSLDGQTPNPYNESGEESSTSTVNKNDDMAIDAEAEAETVAVADSSSDDLFDSSSDDGGKDVNGRTPTPRKANGLVIDTNITSRTRSPSPSPCSWLEDSTSPLTPLRPSPLTPLPTSPAWFWGSSSPLTPLPYSPTWSTSSSSP
ncbi:hypothetical protein HK102_009365, partial [Quaeritorhiza haematococci]